MQDVHVNLSAYPFFKGMKQEYLDLLEKHSEKDIFKTNEYIVKEKDEASKFFLILKGRVSIEICSPEGKPFSIQVLKAGDILGWSWMIPPHEWRFSARAVETTEMLVIDGKYFREKSKKDHDLGYELFSRLAGVFVQRLEATRRQLMEAYNSV